MIRSSIQSISWLALTSGLVLGQLFFSCKGEKEDARLPDVVDFNFHIKPILADRCYKCHGPDEKAREANLRLDIRDGIFGKTKKGEKIIAAGNPDRSALIQHIYSTDPERSMPPPESNLSLSELDKAMLRKWISQGAKWKPHWAFLPLEEIKPPKVRSGAEMRNPIDQFIQARLEKEGIKPSPQADPERLLRRIYMDLTGLPPSVETMDEFLKEPSDAKLKDLVEQLFRSDAYAERMAMDWLDLARYADSHGYHADGWRSMYPWRDWVIKAFKENMPFDRFGTWQLAGDLLPEATEEQILATGFNRNHQITAEGGVIDEEYRMEYVFDRVNTTATAFLGLSMKCAQCHDHKFDPLSQKEYFQFSAFFNNVDELGMNSDDGNCGPTLLLLPDSSKQQLAAIRAQLEKLDSELKAHEDEVLHGESHLKPALNPVKPISTPLEIHLPLDKITKGKNNREIFDSNPNAQVAGQVSLEPGIRGKAACLDDEYEGIFIEDAGLFDRHQPFTAGAWIKPDTGKGFKTIFCNSGDKNSLWRGWDVLIDTGGRILFRLIHALPHDQLKIRTLDKIRFQDWQHVMVTYDGSGRAAGMRVFLNGKRCEASIEYDQLARSILPVDGEFKQVPRPLRMGRWNETFSGEIAFMRGCFDDLRLYSRTLSTLEIANLAGAEKQVHDPETLAEDYLLNRDEKHHQLLNRIRELVSQETRINGGATEVQVMDEDRPRPAYLLERGIYSERREQVSPGTPASVGSFPTNLPQNRLGLAQWIFDKKNPLTARVTVNRYWQLFFGKGIVATPHDFGNQGALPSHPELLDWLAGQFIEHQWDLQWLIRTLIESAAYRRASHPREDLKEVDPQNNLLARGPAFRLPAEMIRDNALSASGLLVNKTGGEPVKPYQPDNIWGEKSFFSPKYLVYQQDSGANLYRRSMYTVIKRTSPHPAMITLDASDRSTCLVQRPSTNTPLQALILLNDPTYIEAARVLAQRLIKEEGKDLESRIIHAFRSLTGRRPSSQEQKLLEELYSTEKERFSKAPEKARQLISIGESPVDEGLDLVETAALTVVNNTIINHDESYMLR